MINNINHGLESELTKETATDGKTPVMGSASRKPWNWGKRKPVTDDCGNKWCDCVETKLTSNAGGRGQAFCLLCMTPWYH